MAAGGNFVGERRRGGLRECAVLCGTRSKSGNLIPPQIFGRPRAATRSFKRPRRRLGKDARVSLSKRENALVETLTDTIDRARRSMANRCRREATVLTPKYRDKGKQYLRWTTVICTVTLSTDLATKSNLIFYN